MTTVPQPMGRSAWGRADAAYPACLELGLMAGLGNGMATEELGTVEIAEPAIELAPALSQGDPADRWLCAWCLNPVAQEADRFRYNNQSEFSFVNPQRIRFHILTFSRALGCQQAGTPTLDHTWFPGHAWSYCLCDRCRTHLGWHYAGPSTFVGLIRDRIVRASLVMN